MSTPPPDLSDDGRQVFYNTISLAFQSLFYGIYAVLIPFSTHILMKRGLRHSRSTRSVFLFSAMFFPFIMSTIYWALQVADLLEFIHVYFVDRSLLSSRNISTYATLFNAIILLNYVSTDAIVVWRAWALCKTEYRKVLFIPVVLLCLTALSVFTTIGLRIASFFTPGGFSFKPVLHAIDICQVSNLVWSLLTNISATSIISHKTWVHRRAIQEGLRSIRNKSTKAERVLALLVESGIIYCLSGATVLISTLIPLPFGTLGDVYTPINIQIAGIYPTIVIVLVGLERTMNNTTFMNTDQGGGVRSRMSQIQFNSDPASTAQRNMTESKITVELVGTDMA